MPSAERQVLVAPDVIAKAASRMASLPEQRWMLGRPRRLRRSFAEEVFERPDEERRQQAWMLRQDAETRESFVRQVLERQRPRPHEQIWMLRQSDDVRESFVREVVLADEDA